MWQENLFYPPIGRPRLLPCWELSKVSWLLKLAPLCCHWSCVSSKLNSFAGVSSISTPSDVSGTKAKVLSEYIQVVCSEMKPSLFSERKFLLSSQGLLQCGGFKEENTLYHTTLLNRLLKEANLSEDRTPCSVEVSWHHEAHEYMNV